MRKLEFHKIAGKGGGYDGNDVLVLDEPGQGGACHRYLVVEATAGTPDPAAMVRQLGGVIEFQNGPIQEVGVNGVQQEDLLAIVIDRLESFQAGPFANSYNQEALDHCKKALAALHQRTTDRLNRGVEGFNKA